MAAVVLCDGAPCSRRAVELAAFPGAFLPATKPDTHPQHQLIFLHVWDPAAAIISPTVSAVAAATEEAAHTATANHVTAANSSAEAVSAGASSVGPAVSAALASSSVAAIRAATAEAAVPDDSREHAGALSVPCVVSATLSALQSQSWSRGVVNYKLEMTALQVEPSAVPANSAPAASPSEGGHRRPKSPSPSSMSHAVKGEKSGPGKSKAAAEGTAKGATSGARPEAEGKAAQSPEEAARAERRRRAAQVAQYAAARAEHHGAHVVLLGVGNARSGKTLIIGPVAEAALATLAARYAVYFTKADGFLRRPTTAMIRLVVVVPLRAEVATAAPAASAGGEGGASRSSVAGAASAAAGAKGTANEEKEAEAGEEGDGHHTLVCFPTSSLCSSLLPPSSTTPPSSSWQREVEGGQAAVRYALSVCRPESKDRVAVMIAAEPAVPTEVLEQYSQLFTSQLTQATSKTSSSPPPPTVVVPSVEGGNEVAVDTAAVVSVNEEGTDTATPLPNADAPLGEDGSGGDAAATGPLAATALRGPTEEEDDATWPAVLTCVLQPSKHVPSPTFDTSVSQVVKQVHQRKLEYVVFAHNAPRVVVRAFLEAPKPHCIVVPSTPL